MGFGKKTETDVPPPDSTAWVLDNGFAEFVLMHTNEIKYMCLVGYTFMHGCKVFKTFAKDDSFPYKFCSMALACTGGGILVPIFLNLVPVPISTDSYPIAIMVSCLIHTFFPVLREVMQLSGIFKAAIAFLYETFRAMVVVKFTYAAGNSLAASEFSFPLFGPIFCGTIAGCGGAFLPFNKGLNPIKTAGLAPPMFTAFVGATFFHLFVNLATDVVDAKQKAHVAVAAWFVLAGFYYNGLFSMVIPQGGTGKVKKE